MFTKELLLRLSLLEILSRFEVPYALYDNYSSGTKVRALVAKINDLHSWKTTYIYKDLTE